MWICAAGPHQITNRFGTIVPVEASISVISGDRGKCLAKVIAVRDVAAYRRLEVEHRVIFESAGDGMVVYTLEGEIVAANQAFCEMNGYACEELIGRNVATLVHPDYHKLLVSSSKTTGRGGSLRARAVNVRKDGTSFPVDVHGTIYEEEGGLRILGVARDVSEEVRAYELLEERVAERTRELELVLEVSQNVASVLELEPLLNLILEQLKTVTAFHWGAILGLEDNRLSGLPAGVTAHPRPVRTAGTWPNQSLPPSGSSSAGESTPWPMSEPDCRDAAAAVGEGTPRSACSASRTYAPSPAAPSPRCARCCSSYARRPSLRPNWATFCVSSVRYFAGARTSLSTWWSRTKRASPRRSRSPSIV